MAQDVNDIVAYGFGSWSSVNWVPTLGFGVGIQVVPDVPGLEVTALDKRMHVTASDGRLHATAKKKQLTLTTTNR